MIGNLTGRVVLVLGVQIPLVIGVTAWMAKRNGVQINWRRVTAISVATFAVLALSLLVVVPSRFGNRDGITVTLFGTTSVCLGLAWLLTRGMKRNRPNRPAGDQRQQEGRYLETARRRTVVPASED